MQGEQLDAFLVEALEKIEECGHVVTYVLDANGDESGLAYTSGLCTRENHSYELAISGMSPEQSRDVLNMTAEWLLENDTQPTDGLEIIDLLVGGYKLRLRALLDLDQFEATKAIYGQVPPVYQVVWPDADNRFAGDPEYAPEYPQPLL